jgi:hypothetical protein
MAATVALALHNIPTWLACIPHAAGSALWFSAQYRYRQLLAAGGIDFISLGRSSAAPLRFPSWIELTSTTSLK